MAHTHREFRTQDIPLAYLISFRAFGTWLHGDSRGSVDRFHDRYRSSLIPPNEQWRKYNLTSLKQPPVKLGAGRRAAIEKAVRETCKIRGWVLLALNARTNHIHTVVSANCKPEQILNAFSECNARDAGNGLLG